MLNELQGLGQVINDMRLAIDNDAPEALSSLFKTYQAYAQVLAGEGLHRFLADENYSLRSIVLKTRQRLQQQALLVRPRLSDQSALILAEQLPLDNQFAVQMLRAYPCCTPKMAHSLNLDPMMIVNGLDNRDGATEELVGIMVEHSKDTAQAILSQMVMLAKPSQIGVVFMSILLKNLAKFDYLDTDIRNALNERKALILSTLDFLVENGRDELGTLPLVALLSKSGVKEIATRLLSIAHMEDFDLKEQANLPILKDLNLVFDPESLQDFISSDMEKGGKEPSFAACVYLSSTVLATHELADAMASIWENAPNKHVNALLTVNRSIQFLKKSDLYDELQACRLVEDMFARIQVFPGLADWAGSAFVKYLPGELIKASNLIDHPAIVCELLETDLGL